MHLLDFDYCELFWSSLCTVGGLLLSNSFHTNKDWNQMMDLQIFQAAIVHIRMRKRTYMAVNTINATVNCGLHAVEAYIHAAFVMTKSVITQWIGIWHAP